MNRLKHTFYTLPIIALWGLGCNKPTHEGERPVARVYDQYLYPSDLAGIYTEMQSREDSQTVARAFIYNWVKNRVLAEKAKRNLSVAEKDVDSQIEEYRNSLLIFRYQQKLLAERLDTIITDEQAKDYFEKNKNNFELTKNLVQLNFVKVNRQDKDLGKIKKLFRSPLPADKEKLATWCETHAANSFLDDEAWLNLDEVKKELPVREYSDEYLLQENKYLEMNEGEYVYLIHIKAFRTRNSFSSIEFEKEKIRSIILQQRKMALLKEMELSVMKEAELNKDFEH